MKYKIFQFSFGDGYAGSAKVAILSSYLLSKKGHDVTLFVSADSLTEKRANELGVKTVSFDTSVSLKKYLPEIFEIFLSSQPQFVISHHSLDRKVGVKLKRKFKNFINIGYRHNITKSFPVIGPIMYNYFYDYLVACSKGVANSLISSGILRRKVKVIYNGIKIPENLDSKTGDEIRSKYSLNGKIVLGLSTWFHKERKGFDLLFNAFNKLDDRYVLLLVGIPKEGMSEVLEYAKEFNIDPQKIIMPGYVDNIWEYYKAMDIFLLPSRSEGFSLALLEAAASKLPIIASNISGTAEFIDNDMNGILFDLERPDKIIDAVNLLSVDKVFAEKLGNNAYLKVMNNFTIEHYADSLENFLVGVFREGKIIREY